MTKLTNLVGEMKEQLEGFNSKGEGWGKTSELQDEMQETFRQQQKMETILKINEKQSRELWDEFKKNNLQTIRVQERQKGNPNEESTVTT